jgi:hypothetical protein
MRYGALCHALPGSGLPGAAGKLRLYAAILDIPAGRKSILGIAEKAMQADMQPAAVNG